MIMTFFSHTTISEMSLFVAIVTTLGDLCVLQKVDVYINLYCWQTSLVFLLYLVNKTFYFLYFKCVKRNAKIVSECQLISIVMHRFEKCVTTSYMMTEHLLSLSHYRAPFTMFLLYLCLVSEFPNSFCQTVY